MEQPSFDLVPCGLVILGTDGRLLEANAAFCQIAEIAPTALPQCKFETFLSPAGRLLFATQISAKLLLEGSVREVALDIVSSAGTRTPVLMNANLERGGVGQPHRIVMAVFGAAERRGYEQGLLRAKRTAEQMAEVISRSSDAIITVSGEGKIQSWNEGAEAIFGFTAGEVVGCPMFQVIFPERLQDELQALLANLRRGMPGKLETIARHRLGHELAVSVTLSPHIEPPGDLVSFSAILRDITPRKLSEKALVQNEKLASLGRMASSIAHEINNPLESVTNLLYILDMQATDPEMRQNIKTAQEELARVSQIATHTLRFHKQNTGPSKLDLTELFASVIAMYRGRMLQHGIKVQASPAGAEPLLCYEGEVRQVITNLIANAIDAMPDGGRLTLRNRDATLWETGRPGVRITIADTGAGMSEATLQHIFEPFFTTKGMGGTGLGLWITHELVQKHQGTIRVRSRQTPGRSGTVFVICFPHEC